MTKQTFDILSSKYQLFHIFKIRMPVAEKILFLDSFDISMEKFSNGLNYVLR